VVDISEDGFLLYTIEETSRACEFGSRVTPVRCFVSCSLQWVIPCNRVILYFWATACRLEGREIRDPRFVEADLAPGAEK